MKKITYLLSIFSVAFTLFSCDQEIDFPYEGKDRIHFQHFKVANEKRVYIDSTVFSFGLKNDTILRDTMKVVVELVGNPQPNDRKYIVEIIPDSTSLIEGVHYEKFDREQVFHAKKVRDTLRIVLIRKNLPSDYQKPKNLRLDLKLKPSTDFDLGLTKGHTIKLLANDYLSEPIWWKGNFQTSLGYFHPKKWRILIQYSDKFANETTCPYDQNDEGRTYTSNLSLYLNQNYVYDYIDGKKYRLNMYSMTLVEE